MKTKKITLSCAFAIFLIISGCATKGNKDSSKDKESVTIEQTDRGVEFRASSAVFFDSGKSDLKSGATELLDKIADHLKNKTKNKSLVEGHTDNTGDESINKTLSEVRALTVMKALIDRGVPKSKLDFKGHGSTVPIASNDTADGRQLNRRTTILIIGEKKENLSGFAKFLNAFNEKLRQLLDLIRGN